MSEIWLVGVAGFAAALVDGSLGMGFGPTSSTLLLSAGVSPVGAAATVNLAKSITGVFSSAAHWRAGNVDRRLALRLAGPGVLGAVVGAAMVSSVDPDDVRRAMAAVLVVIGVRVLMRSALPLRGGPTDRRVRRRRTLAAGFGGMTNTLVGAWGPVVTPVLIQQRVRRNIVVGSVNTAEVAVAVVGVSSLIRASGESGIDPAIVIALLVGGAAAAPLAAALVRRVPGPLIAGGVGVLLLGTQLGPAGAIVGLRVGPSLSAAIAAVAAALTLLLGSGVRRRVADPAAEPASAGLPCVGIGNHVPNRLGEVAVHQVGDGDALHH